MFWTKPTFDNELSLRMFYEITDTQRLFQCFPSCDQEHDAIKNTMLSRALCYQEHYRRMHELFGRVTSRSPTKAALLLR